MYHHRQAVEAAIARVDPALTRRDAPLVKLARALAAQMDQTDGRPSTRLSMAYRGAFRALARRAGTGGTARLHAVSRQGETL